MATERFCFPPLSTLTAALLAVAAGPVWAQNAVGVRGPIGCGENPTQVERLQITEPGIYENYLVDSRWASGNRVKITADGVVLRNCEIRNATGNGVGVFGTNVLIENCRIHHLLHSTYDDQHDAHGVTGRWGNVTIRNCEIAYVSGDAVQFDPDRRSTGRLIIENCTLWTGPLEADAAGFKRGQRPGENAFDSKTQADGPRCELLVRNCVMHGWNQPGQIGTMAALNIKENVDARIEDCLFRDNEVCFRLRGPTSRGGARAWVEDCAVFDSAVGVRLENDIETVRMENLTFGPGVERPYHNTGRRPPRGFEPVVTPAPGSFEVIRASGWKPAWEEVFAEEFSDRSFAERWTLDGSATLQPGQEGDTRFLRITTQERGDHRASVLWCKRPFKGDLRVTCRMRAEAGNRSILYFGARPTPAAGLGSIFAWPRPDADEPRYAADDRFESYSVGILRDDEPRCNVRHIGGAMAAGYRAIVLESRDRGRFQQYGHETIIGSYASPFREAPNRWFEIDVRLLRGRIVVLVDGVRHLDFQDPGDAGSTRYDWEPIPGGGWIGLRNFRPTRIDVDRIVVYGRAASG